VTRLAPAAHAPLPAPTSLAGGRTGRKTARGGGGAFALSVLFAAALCYRIAARRRRAPRVPGGWRRAGGASRAAASCLLAGATRYRCCAPSRHGETAAACRCRAALRSRAARYACFAGRSGLRTLLSTYRLPPPPLSQHAARFAIAHISGARLLPCRCALGYAYQHAGGTLNGSGKRAGRWLDDGSAYAASRNGSRTAW